MTYHVHWPETREREKKEREQEKAGTFKLKTR